MGSIDNGTTSYKDALFLFTLDEFARVCEGAACADMFVIETVGKNGGIEYRGLTKENITYELTCFLKKTSREVKYTIATKQKEVVRTYEYIPQNYGK